MRRPRVRVGAGFARLFRPCAEVKREEFTPWIEGFEVLVRQASMIQRTCEVKPEVVRSRHHAIGCCSRQDVDNSAKHVLLAVFGYDVVEYAEYVGLLAEDLAIGVFSEQAARRHPAHAGDP